MGAAFKSDLSPHNLTSAREKRYYVFVVIVSLVVWALFACTIVGIFYAAVIGFFLWLGHGLLAAHLRAETIRVDERQLPELHKTFLEVCQQLGVSEPPRLHVLQADGALNAFAMRHAGRDFVVVYADMLEALGANSSAMKFILGHELGHLKSRHILKQVLLAPGMLFPLLGPAYRRSWETSCDRHGAYAARDFAGALQAMLTLSGGKHCGRTLDAKAFADQYVEERGFFVSLHELTSTYPTLSRRVSELRALQEGQEAAEAPRNPFAYLVAFFMPGGNLGGGVASVLVVVVIIGMLAAMAIPAFQKVRQSSMDKMCHNNRLMLTAALDQYTLENPGRRVWSFVELVGPGKLLNTMPVCPRQGTYSVRNTNAGATVECSSHNFGQPLPTIDLSNMPVPKRTK